MTFPLSVRLLCGSVRGKKELVPEIVKVQSDNYIGPLSALSVEQLAYFWRRLKPGDASDGWKYLLD